MPPPDETQPAAETTRPRPRALLQRPPGASIRRATLLFVLLTCAMLVALDAAATARERGGHAMTFALIVLAGGFGAGLLARIREQESAGRESARLAAECRLLAEHCTDMVTCVGGDLALTYVSPASRALLGYAPEELIGRTPHFTADPRDWPVIDAALRSLADPDGPAQAVWQHRARRRDGSAVWVEACGRRIAGACGFVITLGDISARKEAERRLEEAMRQDALTALANRRAFDEALAAEYRRAARSGAGLAVVMLDVDRFERFNDRYGHPAGDACLKAIAAAIVGAARRPADLCARTGGAAFAILLTDTDIDGAMHVAGLIGVAIAALGIRHEDSPTGRVTASAGAAAVLPARTPGSPQALVRAADDALCEARRQGRGAARAAAAPFDAAFGEDDAPVAGSGMRKVLEPASARLHAPGERVRAEMGQEARGQEARGQDGRPHDAMAFVRGIFRFGKDGGCDRD